MTPEVVVLGGTFDPVHTGHLAVIEQVLDRTGARLGVLVPVHTPNLRGPAAASPAARLAMLRAAIESHPRLTVSDAEVRRGGVSYTVDTVAVLRAELTSRLALLLGADAARAIQRWHRWRDLVDNTDVIIVNRSGEPPLDATEVRRLGFPDARVLLLQVESPAVRARDVRSSTAAGAPITGLVPAEVESYIAREGLYRASTASA